MHTDTIFEDIIELPDPKFAERFSRLIGLDEIKERLVKEARVLLNPHLLRKWSETHHKKTIPLVRIFQDRLPLFIFGGDIGTGKTTLAESFGDPVSRQENIPIILYRLSLSTRGTGAVGEMTRLLSTAFTEVESASRKGKSSNNKPTSAVILLIDEADALAQSRELAQMHHEDRAGVNTLIRGIDKLATGELPILVVMCTNRLDALDPAVRRRAAATFKFSRPNKEQRALLLRTELDGTGFSEQEIEAIAQATGKQGSQDYGYTYSDLVQNLLPALLLDAFPDKPIRFERAMEIVGNLSPTPPFRASFE